MKKDYSCRACGKQLKIVKKEIIGGMLLKYKEEDGKEHLIFKCNECFKKDPSLSNYQECEVYDRIVGYLRPVQNWNPSKKEEYFERKRFKI
jgi:anaerobic ribonucleoside-triphosphate reductase